MIRQAIALLLSGLTAVGCASAAGPRLAQNGTPAMDRALLADYVARIPAGSKVRVERNAGGTLRGTLLKAGTESLTVQRNTRVPEPPVDIAFDTITRITVDSGSSTGKTVAIAIGTGVGATFGVLLLLAAIWAD